MSDITGTLLQAYLDAITTARLTTLSYIQSHELVQGSISSFSSQYGILPMILIEWGGHTLTPDCFENTYRSDKKEYAINLYGFIEAYDENYGVIGNTTLGYKGSVNLSEDLETLYNRQNFGLSQACICTQNIPITMALPNLSGDGQGYWYYGVQLTFKHLWVDRRLS